MDEYEDDAAFTDDQAPVAEQPAEQTEAATESEKALVRKISKIIKVDKDHFEKAFKRMRRDMFVASHGRDEAWSEDSYTANIVGRHVKMKTSTLYAKNPKAVARRADKMDFVVWDEDPASLMLATQTMQAAQQAQMMAAAGPPQIDPMSGAAVPAQPAMPPGYEQAAALLQDFQDGMARRQMITKIGRTLEILYAKAQRDQQPLDAKAAMKRLVRRACTTGVAYVEVGFVRETGPRPGLAEQLADQQVRLDHLRRLAEEVAEGEINEDDAEMAELQASIEALQAEPEVIVREGLVFDYPRSTRVIPDKLTQCLVGFVGSRHLTIEYDYTAKEIRELFGVDLKVGSDDKPSLDGPSVVVDEDGEEQLDLFDGEQKRVDRGKTIRVWKHYDKPSGLVYYVAEHHSTFLRKPAPPDVFVDSFWPVYAITFNEVENEDEVFPPSDVTLLLHQQREVNRSRQGKREHRDAARPRWAYPNGAFDDTDIDRIKKVRAFDAIGLNIDPQTKLGDILQPFPVPGVDPNLYDTGEVFSDMQLVAGAQEAQLGGLAKATATESAIAAGSSSVSDQASVDDLDEFLTAVARASGQILLREMSEEQVKLIVGPGAVWPQMTLSDIADELYLEVEAGSSGRPNQATEIHNFERLVPLLLQIPGINPTWLAKETIKRLDDRLDVAEAVAAGIPAIVAQNRMQQPMPQDPGASPDQQGLEGQDQTQKPPEQEGSAPAFGSNQV